MRSVVAAILACALPGLIWAQTVRGGDAVLAALRLGDLLRIMQIEAVETGADLAEGVVSGGQMVRWRATLDRINDSARLLQVMADDFDAVLPPQDVAPILAFLETPQGVRVIGLELSARQALLNPDIEARSEEIYRQRRAARDPRVALVERFAQINDLVDSNVRGAMNANVAFLQGMRSGGGAPPGGQSDVEIAAQVLAQEPEIRASTEEWIHAFLLMAYAPLSDEDLGAYIAFSETSAGQSLNRALFSAFERIFVSTSRETGEAFGRLLISEDL
ncbi:MAG: hypothetical protein ACK5IB_09645 [Qingshengfaniella sp.]